MDEILKASKSLSGRDKIEIYLEILPYLYPKRKPTEAIPLTLENHIDSLTMPEIAKLHGTLGDRIGLNKPTRDLSMEQLLEYRGTLNRLISHRETLEELKDDNLYLTRIVEPK